MVISLTAEQVVEMPVDELALAVVADLIATREWNEYNYLNSATQHPPVARDAYATRAVAGAFGWARTHGLIARTPGQSADAAIFVTRAGQEAVTDGLVTLRAAARLGSGLHPLIERRARRQFLLGEFERWTMWEQPSTPDATGIDLSTRRDRDRDRGAGGSDQPIVPLGRR